MDIMHLIGLVLFLGIVGAGAFWALRHRDTLSFTQSDPAPREKGDKADRSRL